MRNQGRVQSAQPRGRRGRSGRDARALTIADTLDLESYCVFHTIRADLLRRVNRLSDAALAYDAAIAHSSNAAERAFLERQRATLARPPAN